MIAKKNNSNIVIDQVKDFEEFVEIGKKSKKVGVIYVGGGVPKNFTQLLAVAQSLTKSRQWERIYPHKYAIQITTDSPQWVDYLDALLKKQLAGGRKILKARMCSAIAMRQLLCR